MIWLLYYFDKVRTIQHDEIYQKENLKITDKFKSWYLVRIFALIFEFVRQKCSLEK